MFLIRQNERKILEKKPRKDSRDFSRHIANNGPQLIRRNDGTNADYDDPRRRDGILIVVVDGMSIVTTAARRQGSSATKASRGAREKLIHRRRRTSTASRQFLRINDPD